MLNKFKGVFIVLMVFCFSFSTMHANQNDLLKTIDFYSKMKSKQKKKKERKKNCSYSTTQNFSSSKNVKSKNFNVEIISEKAFQNLDYDMDLFDSEIFFKLVNSKFGYNLSLQNQKLLKAIKEIYFSDNADEISLLSLLTEEYDIKNVMDTFSDLEKVNSLISLLSVTDLPEAEIAVNNISDKDLKNLGFELIFNNYIYKKDPQNAQRIFSLIMSEDIDDDTYEDLQILILAYLRNKDFESAEKIVQTLYNSKKGFDDYDKDKVFINIIKYYSRVNDSKNANRILEKISHPYIKDRAKIYILDLYARQKNIVEFQKLAISSPIDDDYLLQASKFILAFYENNLQEAIQNRVFCEDLIIDNFVELLCSSNQVKEAEQLINTFCDEDEKEPYNLFLINAYLKNGNFEEAKRLKDEMQGDFISDKWIASKLISVYETK